MQLIALITKLFLIHCCCAHDIRFIRETAAAVTSDIMPGSFVCVCG